MTVLLAAVGVVVLAAVVYLVVTVVKDALRGSAVKARRATPATPTTSTTSRASRTSWTPASWRPQKRRYAPWVVSPHIFEEADR